MHRKTKASFEDFKRFQSRQSAICIDFKFPKKYGNFDFH